MSLQPGQKLAHYRVERKIGEGGMGEVYAATDTRLNRAAAIKALPAVLAAEPERLARFKREAQLLAALSHPNIAGIYGLEQVDDASYLALELVEGDDLSLRMDGRKLPYDEAVEIALQIAAALDAAHEKGIVHRDLKPANIKLDDGDRPVGLSPNSVKVLDFGLAKALSDDPDGNTDSVDLTTSPTLTAVMGTQAGVILGTAGYMAPEQARGKKVDRRADIWAFGVILFEMLTGERMFTGETVTDVIAQVVTRDPDWEQLPADTPPAIRRVLRRCLQKDPRKRLRDIGDAALELRGEFEDETDALPASAVDAPAGRSRGWLLGLAGLALGLILATVISMGLRDSGTESTPTWTNLAAPAGIDYTLEAFFEISPDGRRVVFVAEPADGNERMLWVRDLGDEQARMLPGTEGAEQPFWSPDSAYIGYFAKRRLRRISVDGGPSTALDDTGDMPRGAHWGDDGTILFGPDWSQPLYRIPATGGTTTRITELSEERLELSHRWPHLLPDGKHFLFYAVSTYPALNPENPAEIDKSGLYIGSLDGDEPRLLQAIPSRVSYVDGWLLYVDDNVLTARPFDLASLSFDGEPVVLATEVTQSADSLWGGALFSASDEGTLMFARGARETRGVSQLTWIDREGRKLETVGEARDYVDVTLAPDDRKVAVSIGDPADIWIVDLERDTSTRFTFDPGSDDSPCWSPDGDTLLFQSSRLIPGERFKPSNIYKKAASGLEQEVYLPAEDRGPSLYPTSWSPDGGTLGLTVLNPKTGADILFYSFQTGDLQTYLATPGDEETPRFSPNGRWLAYSSTETGTEEIYVTAYPESGGKWQVSNGGGEMPEWRADGRELFYTTQDEEMMAVPVETEEVFRHGTPVKLFKTPSLMRIGSNFAWDVSADGERFIFLASVEGADAEAEVVTVVQGWQWLLP